MIKNTHQKGFTLIELSIVLVIVGLLVGGVIVGRDLVKNAKVRKQIKQIEQYQSAYNAFKLKYNCIPGDCQKATTFFSTAANGNGNTKIDFTAAGGGATTSYAVDAHALNWNYTHSQELLEFFLQLSLAGMTDFHPKPNTYEINQAVPDLMIDNKKGFFVSYSGNFSGTRLPDMGAYKTGNNLMWMVYCNPPSVSGQTNMRYWDNGCGVFTPVELKLIDGKLDNGLPLSGRFFGFSGDVTVGYEDTECVNPGRTDYNLTNTGKWCQAAFVLD